MFARGRGPEPEELLELYDFEACPACRRVREVLSELDLDAMIYPCPVGGTRYRPQAKERATSGRFPFLVDPNTGVEASRADEIIAYLYEHYGTGKPSLLVSEAIALPTGILARVVRGNRGGAASPSRAPEQPLELYSFEASPFCRLAREALCELEVPYRLHNVGKGSRHRAAFRERSGRMMVPYLVDPNTGTEMFESADIVRYLRETYGGLR